VIISIWTTHFQSEHNSSLFKWKILFLKYIL
jgi:hypothetical protein